MVGSANPPSYTEAMNRLLRYRLVPLFALALVSAPALAASTSNLEREKSWADQIVDTLIAGDAVWLQADGVKFLGLYTSPAQPSKKGVILLHGRGVHPAWGFIDNLRVDFADAGWHTLSLQMPILDADVKLAEYAKTFPEAFDRIDAGVRYLKQRGVKQIFLEGHSSGGLTAVAYIAERPKAPIAGVVAVGLTSEPAGGPRMQPVQILNKITMTPILDVYGSEDDPDVLRTVDARRAAAKKAGNRGYTQQVVKGANHFHTGRYDELKSVVSAWLNKLAK